MPAQFIDIPRTTASKARSGCTFLDLPSEIRTLVYARIFEHTESIRFEYSKNQEQVLSEGTHGGKKTTMSPVPIKSDAHTSIRDGINFLLSCRQIYHEAASVLYSNNTFVFGKVPDEHVGMSGQIQLAANWCSGSQMQYVRKVEIDIANACSGHACTEHSSEFQGVDIAPLVKAMWSPSAAKAGFEFVRSYARPSNGRLRKADLLQLFDTKTTNKVLEYLRADADGFKKYSRQVVVLKTWLFPNVPAHNLDDVGYIELGRSERYRDANQYLMLELNKKKGESRATVRTQAPHLLGLPKNVRKQICREILVSKKDVCLDLSTGKKPNVRLRLFPVKDFMDDEILKAVFWGENTFNFRLRSNTTPTSFEDFRALERLLCHEKDIGGKNCQWAGRIPQYSVKQHGKIKIELDFDKAAAATLSDVRIDIAALLRSTSSYCGDLVDFHICLGLDGADGVLVEQSFVTLSALRINTMMALAQIGKKYPELLVATEFAFYVNGHRALKTIEIHGADELHVFREDAFQPVDGLSLACARDHDWDHRYDGTLQYWVRYLETIAVACEERNRHGWARYLQRIYFGVR